MKLNNENLTNLLAALPEFQVETNDHDYDDKGNRIEIFKSNGLEIMSSCDNYGVNINLTFHYNESKDEPTVHIDKINKVYIFDHTFEHLSFEQERQIEKYLKKIIY